MKIVAISLFFFTLSVGQARAESPTLMDPNPAPTTLKVTLDDVTGGVIGNKNVFKGYGCNGENQSPAIHWTGAPKDTQSFAIVVHDPDAPTGVGFFHWVVVDIPKGTTSLPANASAIGMPLGALQTHTDFGITKYGGPCPPPGPAHHYIFTVYALKVPKLGVDANATGALVRFMLHDTAIAMGRVTATYGRK